MMPTNFSIASDGDEHDGDRPSADRVERFLAAIEEERTSAARRRWLGIGVGALIGGVAALTALGIVPVGAENMVLSAGAVVAGLALSRG
jgi:hypothetical protein